VFYGALKSSEKTAKKKKISLRFVLFEISIDEWTNEIDWMEDQMDDLYSMPLKFYLPRIAVKYMLRRFSYWERYWITGQWQFQNSGFVSEPLLIERTYEGEQSVMSLGAFVTCNRSVVSICIVFNRRLRWFTRQMENISLHKKCLSWCEKKA